MSDGGRDGPGPIRPPPGATDGSRAQPARIRGGGDGVNRAVRLGTADRTLGTLALADAATLDAAREQGLALALDWIGPLDAAIGVRRIHRVGGWRDGSSMA